MRRKEKSLYFTFYALLRSPDSFGQTFHVQVHSVHWWCIFILYKYWRNMQKYTHTLPGENSSAVLFYYFLFFFLMINNICQCLVGRKLYWTWSGNEFSNICSKINIILICPCLAGVRAFIFISSFLLHWF